MPYWRTTDSGGVVAKLETLLSLKLLQTASTRWPNKIGTIGQWRRRLGCVVQQHIEHLLQKLQDVTATLDNNWDNKHVVSCC